LRPDDRARYGQGDSVRKGRQVTPASGPRDLWGDAEHRPLVTVARNVSTRYLAIATDAIIGLLLLPFNVRELGPSAYGLWMLTASLTTYFSILDLGYGGSIVRFVAHYRARRDARVLNEIASTLFGIFSITGCVSYVVFLDRKSTRLNSSHEWISYAVFCLKKKTTT